MSTKLTYIPLIFIFVTVNLRTSVKLRRNRIPKHNRLRLEKLLKTNDDIISYFFEMFRKHAAHLDPELGTPIGGKCY